MNTEYSFVQQNKYDCTDHCLVHIFSLISCNGNHTCMDGLRILLGPYRGFLFPLTWPGENSARKGFAYLPTVWLASCRIRLNCFFILYFLR